MAESHNGTTTDGVQTFGERLKSDDSYTIPTTWEHIPLREATKDQKSHPNGSEEYLESIFRHRPSGLLVHVYNDTSWGVGAIEQSGSHGFFNSESEFHAMYNASMLMHSISAGADR